MKINLCKTNTSHNYFLGNDKKKWASRCYAYSDITYEDFYPGIDMRIYEKNLDLKYDFTLQPNSKNVIKIKYSGQDKIRLNKKGNLIIETSLGQVIETLPLAGDNESTTISLSEAGVYLVHLQNEAGVVLSTKRVVIQ